MKLPFLRRRPKGRHDNLDDVYRFLREGEGGGEMKCIIALHLSRRSYSGFPARDIFIVIHEHGGPTPLYTYQSYNRDDPELLVSFNGGMLFRTLEEALDYMKEILCAYAKVNPNVNKYRIRGTRVNPEHHQAFWKRVYIAGEHNLYIRRTAWKRGALTEVDD